MEILQEETLKFLSEWKGFKASESRNYMNQMGNCRVAEIVNQLKGVYCMLPKQPTEALPPHPTIDTPESFVTVATDGDVMRAMNQSAMAMIRRMQQLKKLSALDAYSLASLALDTRISQLEPGAKSIYCLLPKSLWVTKAV
jgi:acetamidase/formamidase